MHICTYGTPHKKFTFHNYGKQYLAYVSTIQVQITLQESTLTKVRRYVRNLTYVSTYSRRARLLFSDIRSHYSI